MSYSTPFLSLKTHKRSDDLEVQNLLTDDVCSVNHLYMTYILIDIYIFMYIYLYGLYFLI